MELILQDSFAIVCYCNTLYGKDVSTYKVDKHFDFALDTSDILYLIKVSYYGSNGSKLKSIANEFSSLYTLVKNEITGFIWVTDEEGWKTAK